MLFRSKGIKLVSATKSMVKSLQLDLAMSWSVEKLKLTGLTSGLSLLKKTQMERFFVLEVVYVQKYLKSGFMSILVFPTQELKEDTKLLEFFS